MILARSLVAISFGVALLFYLEIFYTTKLFAKISKTHPDVINEEHISMNHQT